MNRPDTDDEETTVARLLGLAGPPPEPDAARATRVEARLRAELDRERARRRHRVSWRSAAAALVIVAVALWMLRAAPPAIVERLAPAPEGLLVSVASLSGETADRVDGRRLAAGSLLRPGAEPATTAGARAALAWPGDRSLRLDGGTHLRLLAADRVELLAGALYFDAPPRADGPPLTVVARGIEIVELGTQFEVRLAATAVVARVREGRIRIDSDGTHALLPAGRRAEVVPGAPLVVTEEAPDAPSWDWVWRAAPPFPVEGRTLREFLDWYRRETRHELTVDESRSASLDAVLHGSIGGLSPDQALETLAAATGWGVVRGPGGSRLTSPEAQR